MTQVVYLSDGCPDGINFGRSDDKIGFYGLTTPIAQQDFTAAELSTVMTTATPWGFASSTTAQALISLVNEIRAKLVALNLVAT